MPTQPETPRSRLDAAATAMRAASTPVDRDAARRARDEALAEIVSQHAAWRRDPSTGARADLAGADLAGADLAGADLAGADLAGASLAGAYLADAYLAGASLAGAYLAGASLAGASLADAYLADADLAGADLADAYLAGAYLAGANLADADLADADLADPSEPHQRGEPTSARRAERARRFRERHPEVPVVERLDSHILDAVTKNGGALDMGAWHTCETTHCRAGWAIHLAGEKGYELERIHGPARAGRMIYRASTGRAPHFFAPDERALEDLRRCAAEEAATSASPEVSP